MKRFNWLLMGIMILSISIIPLTGCASQLGIEMLQADLATLAEENSKLEADLASTNAELVSLQTDYDALSSSYDELNEDYEAVTDELSQMKQIYPPRDFNSLSELRDWVENNDVSEKPVTQYVEDWYVRSLEIQEDAIKDGYVVSADYDVDEDGLVIAWCTAIAGGRLFYWDPETDVLFEEFALGTLK